MGRDGTLRAMTWRIPGGKRDGAEFEVLPAGGRGLGVLFIRVKNA